MSSFQLPQSRYVLPSFVERTAYGVKESNPYNKLFEERIVFLGVQVDDASANDVMAQLLYLESDDPDRQIDIYINSPGGSFTALMAIYDTMQYVRPNIRTVCLGQAASAAAVLLAAGTKGQRLALLFTARHKPGQLAAALDQIGARGFNMECIKSRPLPHVPFEYYFYVQIVCPAGSTGAGCQTLLDTLTSVCSTLRLLGAFTLDSTEK